MDGKCLWLKMLKTSGLLPPATHLWEALFIGWSNDLLGADPAPSALPLDVA